MATVGQRIREARTRRGLSIARLAASTRILSDQLAAIERDDFSRLPAPVYVRGFIRSIAKELQIPESDLLLAFDRQVSLPGPGNEESSSNIVLPYGMEQETPSWNIPKIQPAVAFGLAVALVMLGLFFAGLGEAPTQTAQGPGGDVADVQPAR